MSDGIKIATVAPEVDPDTGILEPGVPVEEIHGRMMDFLCHVLEARFWSYAMHEWSWPQAFAGVLADDEREAESVLLRCRLHWEACLLAEACGHVRPGLAELRKQIYWQSWPANQVGFRVLAHFRFGRHPTVLQHFGKRNVRLGDSKVAEEVHKLFKSTADGGLVNNQAELTRLYHQLTLSTIPLGHRGIPHVHVDENHNYERWEPRRRGGGNKRGVIFF